MSVDMIKVSNYIRQNASDSYRAKVPKLSAKSPIGELSNPLLEYSVVMNEYASGLIDYIGDNWLNRMTHFTNKLSKFKRTGNGLGIDTREIARGLVNGMDYEFTTEGIAKMFHIYPQEYAECFHRLNRQRIFPITFSRKLLKQSLTSWGDLENFVADLTDTLTQSNEQEEYELMIELIRASVNADDMKTIELSGAVEDETSGKEFVKVVKNIVGSFQYRDNSNSVWGRQNPTTKIMPIADLEDINVILPYSVKNEIAVDTLAGAFNKDELTFNTENVTEVDSLGFIVTGESGSETYYAVDAIVCDRNWFRVIDDPDNEINGNDLPTARAFNRYAHIWQTLSTSPFMCVNAIVHEVESTDIPEGYFDNLIEREETIVDDGEE